MSQLKFSTILFSLLFIYAPTANGQTKNEVVTSMLKAISSYQNFNVKFLVDHDFHSSDDTSKKIINATYVTDSKGPVIGYAEETDTTHQDYYALAYNKHSLVRYFKIQGEYSETNAETKDADEKYLYRYKIDDNYYTPFFHSINFFKDVVLIESNSQFYVLMKSIDSSAGQNKKKWIILVSKTTFLPMVEEFWAWFDGGDEYKKYALLSIEGLPKNSAKVIEHKADSLMRYYKTFINGDSLYKVRMAQFKELKVGDSAKNFTGYIHGSTDSVEINKMKDAIIILDFSYTTCGPCAAAVPRLIAINDLYKNKGVKLFSINPMSGDWKNLDKFIGYFKMNFPVLKVNYNIAMNYGIRGYPTLFIIKNGIVKFVHPGYNEDMENVLKKEIDKLL